MSAKKRRAAYYENEGYRFDAQLVKALVKATIEMEAKKTPEAGRQAKPRTQSTKKG